MTEKEMLQKADLVLADLATNGGLLSPEQSNRFSQVLLEQPTILGAARTVLMAAPEMKINKIGFGSRIMRPAVENTGLVSADRSKPTTTQINLTTKEVIAEIRLPYEMLEDNIEGDNVENTIIDLIAKRAALDFEELIILGDVASSDPWLALFDGLIKRVQTHVVNASTTYNTVITYGNMLKALPPRFRRNLNLLKFFVGFDTEQDYRVAVAGRQTILGDALLQGGKLSALGVEMVPVSLMPTGTGVLTDPQNMLIGIRRRFTIESQRMISERQIKIVLSARVGMALETEEAMVKVINIGNAP